MEPGDEVRFRLTLHYDGSRFFGWQVQREERTVQGEVQAAVKRLTGADLPVIGSGRTDRGVHARGQVAAVSVPSGWSPGAFQRALNAVLPDDVWVRSVELAPASFHPRYDAVARSYVYNLGLVPEARSPFVRFWCWPLCEPLDTSLLEEAAARIPGEHSFGAFAKAGQEERGQVCAVREASWEPWDSLGARFIITADRYLHHMVRYLVGTMVDVARQRRPLEDLRTLLDDRAADLETSPPAPPEGLFLERVEYPAHVPAPEAALGPE